MLRPIIQDVLILVTSPVSISEPRDYSPFEAANPEELVFTCYFKEPDQRTEFLAQVKREAGAPPDETMDRDTAIASFTREHARLTAEGHQAEAFNAVIRWWSGILRKSYHTYSLKMGFGPYRSSCIISFEELDTDTLKFNLTRATEFMEREQARVLDFFGFPGVE